MCLVLVLTGSVLRVDLPDAGAACPAAELVEIGGAGVGAAGAYAPSVVRVSAVAGGAIRRPRVPERLSRTPVDAHLREMSFQFNKRRVDGGF